MRYVVLVLFLPAFAAAQGNEAEKLYRQVEKKVTDARALEVAGEVDVTAKENPMKAMKGVLTLAGNKLRLNVDMEQGGKKMKVEVVSDGKSVKTLVPTMKSEEKPAKKNQGEILRKLVARVGLVGILMIGRVQEGDAKEVNVDDLLPVSDFKMEAAEKIGGRDAKVISYKVTPKGDKTAATVTLWVDAKTLVPLKHLIAPQQEGIRLTATYATFDLNPKIDPKSFELPR